MKFSDVIDQQEVRRQLVNVVAQQRVSHALLFLGNEGSGALPLARAFAQYLLCEKVLQAGAPSLFGESSGQLPADSCGTCPSCQKSAAAIHPDIHFSYPVISSKSDKPTSADFIEEWRKFIKEQPYGNNFDWLQSISAENKQGNISTSEVADILRKLNLKSFEGAYKILIMWLPEFLGKEGNRLLKLIEEPPPDTIFILVAETESLILPTIISRTQLVRIKPLQITAIEKALEEIHQVPAQRARQIALISNGNYREALLQLTETEDDWETMLRDWMNSIIKTGPQAQVKWVEDISKLGREKQKQFLRYFVQLIEISIHGKFIAPSEETIAGKEYDFARRLGKLCGIEQLGAMSRELENAIYHIERNANAKIEFHALTIRLYYIISNKSVILVH
jgi:DNA polymerase-3 subunit delta'